MEKTKESNEENKDTIEEKKKTPFSGSEESLEYQPLITANYNKGGAQLIMYFEFCIILLIIMFTNRYFYVYMFTENLWLLLLLPLAIYGLLWQFSLLTLFLSKIIYSILKWREPPKEGEFPLDSREFKFYCYRFWIAYYSIYMLRAMPLPWADLLGFRMFGVKVGKNVVLYDCWIDFEFIEIGDNVMVSLNSSIFSHCIYRDKFLVAKVIIEKNGIVGANATVAPGTILREGGVIGSIASTHIGQELSEYVIHIGNPCSRTFPIMLLEGEDEQKLDPGARASAADRTLEKKKVQKEELEQKEQKENKGN